MGCKAVMASEHDVEITTGVGAFEKSPVWRTGLYAPQVGADQARGVLQHATRTMVTTSRPCRETAIEGSREPASSLTLEALAA